MQVKDEALLDEFRAKRKCEYCGRKAAGCHPHHVYARGMGGGSRLDLRINVIGLCVDCHAAAHVGQIEREALIALVCLRESVLPDFVTSEIHRLRREPKREDHQKATQGDGR